MKHLQLFENFKLIDINSIYLTLRDICYELDDEGVNWSLSPCRAIGKNNRVLHNRKSFAFRTEFHFDLERISPDDDIRKNILSFQTRDLLDYDRVDFYLQIFVNKNLTDKEKRSGFFSAPEWFIEFIKRIEQYMKEIGFTSYISVRLPGDTENLTVDELSEYNGLVQSIKIDFKYNKK